MKVLIDFGTGLFIGVVLAVASFGVYELLSITVDTLRICFGVA